MMSSSMTASPGARVAAAKARQKAEEQVFDPLYHVIANVSSILQMLCRSRHCCVLDRARKLVFLARSP
jgi:hypothetical protein